MAHADEVIGLVGVDIIRGGTQGIARYGCTVIQSGDGSMVD